MRKKEEVLQLTYQVTPQDIHEIIEGLSAYVKLVDNQFYNQLIHSYGYQPIIEQFNECTLQILTGLETLIANEKLIVETK